RSAINIGWNYAANFAGLATSGFLVLAAADRIRTGDRRVPPALFLAIAAAAVATQIGAVTATRELYRDQEWMSALRIVSSLGQPLLLVALVQPNNRLQQRVVGLQLALVIVISAGGLGIKQATELQVIPVHLFLNPVLQPTAAAIVLSLVVLRPSLSAAS